MIQVLAAMIGRALGLGIASHPGLRVLRRCERLITRCDMRYDLQGRPVAVYVCRPGESPLPTATPKGK